MITRIERNYVYDAEGRLAEVSEAGRVVRISYDPAGNRTSVEVISPGDPTGPSSADDG